MSKYYNINSHLSSGRTQYTRTLAYPSGFAGVDLSAPERSIAANRFAYIRNMWKDYLNENGAAVETFPGWRQLRKFSGAINGLFRYREWIVVHSGNGLYAFRHAGRDSISGGNVTTILGSGMADRRSSAFVSAGSLWILDGQTYRKVTYNGSTWSAAAVTASSPYVPTLHTSINDTVGYEQRNMLTNTFNELYTVSESDVTEITETPGLKYEVISSTERTLRCTGIDASTVDELYIPSRKILGGVEYRVLEIGGFSEKKINSVTLEDGIETISENAFKNCSISWITIPKSVKYIGSRALWSQMHNDIIIYLEFGGLDRETGNDVGFPVAKLAIGDNGIDRESSILLYFAGTNEQLKSIRNSVLTTEDEYYFKQTDLEIEINYITQSEFPKIQRKYSIPLYSPWSNITGLVLGGKTVGTNQSSKLWRGTVTIGGVTRFFIAADNADDIYGKVAEITGTLQTGYFTDADGMRSTYASCINGCTICAEYDGRIFLSGNPNHPNTVWYTQRDLLGYNRPDYVGELNRLADGSAGAVNRAMITSGDVLLVLQSSGDGSGRMFVHSGVDSGEDLTPRIYPSTYGYSEREPAGAACNFLDDPVFLTSNGLDAIAKQSVNLERSLEHRSSNVDAEMLKENLTGCSMAEWLGYLLILCPSGKVYMADSRQIFTHNRNGTAQYEWYILDDFGVYEGQTTGYGYSTDTPPRGIYVRFETDPVVEKITSGVLNVNFDVDYEEYGWRADELIIEYDDSDDGQHHIVTIDDYTDDDYDWDDTSGRISIDATGFEYCLENSAWNNITYTAKKYSSGFVYTRVNNADEVGNVDPEDVVTEPAFYSSRDDDPSVGNYFHAGFDVSFVSKDGNLLRVTAEDEYTGGTFTPASLMLSTGEVLYFGTESGDLCCINTDKRDSNGEIPRRYYDRNGRRFTACCTTVYDDCGYPHINKCTVPMSVDISLRTRPCSEVDFCWRTDNRDEWRAERICNAVPDFADFDFADGSFSAAPCRVAVADERAMLWTVKQYHIRSDAFRAPFGIYHIAYRYRVGRRIRR